MLFEWYFAEFYVNLENGLKNKLDCVKFASNMKRAHDFQWRIEELPQDCQRVEIVWAKRLWGTAECYVILLRALNHYNLLLWSHSLRSGNTWKKVAGEVANHQMAIDVYMVGGNTGLEQERTWKEGTIFEKCLWDTYCEWHSKVFWQSSSHFIQ